MPIIRSVTLRAIVLLCLLGIQLPMPIAHAHEQVAPKPLAGLSQELEQHVDRCHMGEQPDPTSTHWHWMMPWDFCERLGNHNTVGFSTRHKTEIDTSSFDHCEATDTSNWSFEFVSDFCGETPHSNSSSQGLVRQDCRRFLVSFEGRSTWLLVKSLLI